MIRPVTVLSLSGSLRKASLNTAMLALAADCAPPGMRMQHYPGLGELPLFNPDLEGAGVPSVAHLRDAIESADALLIASPEYAHGVSGVMKNALDWMVATGVFVSRPVVLWNAAPRASLALAALRETLAVMSARLVDAADLTLLIQAPEAGCAWINPDRDAMRGSLLVLRDILRLEQSGSVAPGPVLRDVA